jgi:mono/diheme cytochrome c family protein
MKRYVGCLFLLAATGVHAGDPDFLDGAAAKSASGEAIFTHICQGCHMPQGQGAHGAGTYPALAKDARLLAKTYPVAMVLNGRSAMPAIGQQLSDEQVAAVVNYVRTHFGNDYHDAVTVAEVKAMRP